MVRAGKIQSCDAGHMMATQVQAEVLKREEAASPWSEGKLQRRSYSFRRTHLTIWAKEERADKRGPRARLLRVRKRPRKCGVTAHTESC